MLFLLQSNETPEQLRAKQQRIVDPNDEQKRADFRHRGFPSTKTPDLVPLFLPT